MSQIISFSADEDFQNGLDGLIANLDIKTAAGSYATLHCISQRLSSAES